MTTTSRFTHALAVGLLLAGVACGGTGGPSVVPGGGGITIPNFTFGFAERGNTGHRFFLFPNAENIASGTFVPPSNEQLSNNAPQSVVTGTFSGETMELTIARSAGNVRASGRFLTADSIQLTFQTSPTSVITVDRIRP